MIATTYYLARMASWVFMAMFYLLAYTGLAILWITRLCMDAAICMWKGLVWSWRTATKASSTS